MRLVTLLLQFVICFLQFHSQLKDALDKKTWEKVRPPPATSNQVRNFRLYNC